MIRTNYVEQKMEVTIIVIYGIQIKMQISRCNEYNC